MSTCTVRKRRCSEPSEPSEPVSWISTGNTPLLSVEEEYELFSRVQQGDVEARDHAVRANLALVIFIARDFMSSGVPMEDLTGYGNLGLIKAVESYDPARERRFSTFASHWIKQSIRMGISEHKSFTRLPSHVRVRVAKWHRMEHVLAESLGRHPTHAETAEALGLSKARTAVMLQAVKADNASNRTPGNADADASMLAETLVDPRNRNADRDIIDAGSLERALERTDTLNEREAMVIRLRFGIGSGRRAKLREVGEALGLTRERVRQIEAGALTKLRAALEADADFEGEW